MLTDEERASARAIAHSLSVPADEYTLGVEIERFAHQHAQRRIGELHSAILGAVLALEQAQNQFARYAQEHRAKRVSPETLEKAKVNENMSFLMTIAVGNLREAVQEA